MRRHWLIPSTILFVISFLVGCATPKPFQNNRAGLFDHANPPGVTQFSAKGHLARQPAGDSPVPVNIKQGTLRWPLDVVRVSSRFGQRGRHFHEGIDLKAAIGTPVYSAESGTVLYAASRIRGYGKMVVIRHAGAAKGLATIYAHNSKLLVRPGQKVKKGQKIAISGQTGKSNGPHLHFEIRSGVAAIDPEILLKQPKVTKAASLREPIQKAKPKNRARLAAVPVVSTD